MNVNIRQLTLFIYVEFNFKLGNILCKPISKIFTIRTQIAKIT